MHERERTVVQLHLDRFQHFQCRSDFEQLQDHRLILAQHFTGSNTENQRVTDLTSGTSHRYANRLFHHAFLHCL